LQHESIASTLVSHGANVNVRTATGQLLLHHFVFKANTSAATFLINVRNMQYSSEMRFSSDLHASSLV
jgi:ankyrin repeat protein